MYLLCIIHCFGKYLTQKRQPFLTIRGTVKLHSFSLIYVSFINCGVGFDDIYDIGERSRSNIEMGGLYIHSN